MKRDNNDVAQDGVESAASLLWGEGCLSVVWQIKTNESNNLAAVEGT